MGIIEKGVLRYRVGTAKAQREKDKPDAFQGQQDLKQKEAV